MEEFMNVIHYFFVKRIHTKLNNKISKKSKRKSEIQVSYKKMKSKKILV